ncbi:MAG: sulfatase-like hydrolase/transferase, partial [Parasphingopyxis sp.]
MGRVIGALLVVCALAAPATLLAQAEPLRRPNIVLILADDVGFTDLGAYGSEIATPNIDALARRGMIFTNFHATPMCAPSRAMLMTGIDSHAAGIGNLPETTPEEHRGSPAYLGRLRPGVRTIAERLRAAGYRTYMTGKWHLGHTADTLPRARGFDRSFILDATGADNWEHRPYLPYYDRAEWYEDGEAAHELPEDFYSSEFLVDRLIRYLGRGRAGRPFFAYLAFQAIHIPVQAPREFTERYAGRYDDGWQALRETRHRAAIARGLFPEDAPLRAMRPEMRDWDELSDEDRGWYAQAMAVNAGMLEAMDHHLGRLIDYLRQSGEYENTIFIITSDNGPEGALPTASLSMRVWMRLVGYSTERETLGERGSYGFIGPEWASAAASPHDLFKFYAGEGGTRVPLIVAGPGIETGMARQLSLISDIPATLAGLGGADVAG